MSVLLAVQIGYEMSGDLKARVSSTGVCSPPSPEDIEIHCPVQGIAAAMRTIIAYLDLKFNDYIY